MIHMTKEFDLTEGSFSINPVIKCIPNLLYGNLLFCLGIDWTTALHINGIQNMLIKESYESIN